MTEMNPTFEELQTNLFLLSEKLNSQYTETEWLAQIDHSLDENNLDSTDPIPEWLVSFTVRLLEAKEIDQVSFERTDSTARFERRWLGFINSVVGGEWNYDGESESVAFDQIGLQAIIDYESSSYYLITY